MKKVIFILLILSSLGVSQDNLRGKIVDNNLSPLSNATIHWLNSNIGTTTNNNGEFQISKDNNHEFLIISFIGFKADTVQIEAKTNSIIRVLEKDNNLNTIELIENFDGAYIDHDKAIKIEVITEKELTKAACCELAGCFETQASVESKTTNVLTNTKELSIVIIKKILPPLNLTPPTSISVAIDYLSFHSLKNHFHQIEDIQQYYYQK